MLCGTYQTPGHCGHPAAGGTGAGEARGAGVATPPLKTRHGSSRSTTRSGQHTRQEKIQEYFKVQKKYNIYRIHQI